MLLLQSSAAWHTHRTHTDTAAALGLWLVYLRASWQLVGQDLHDGVHRNAGGPHAGAKGDLRLLNGWVDGRLGRMVGWDGWVGREG